MLFYLFIARYVTNLFFYVRAVCMLFFHFQCVIQSYLSWLEDSDYDPNCIFCSYPLAHPEIETVRLPCLRESELSAVDAST